MSKLNGMKVYAFPNKQKKDNLQMPGKKCPKIKMK